MDIAKQAPALRQKHQEIFGDKPAGVYAAPGRVNLIGEHTDYAGGFVMPAAIDFATLVSMSPRDDDRIAIFSVSFDEQIEHALDAIPAKGSGHWSDYPLGVLHVLRGRGMQVPGVSLTIQGDVPLGAGLSSSASIELATMLALLATIGTTLPGPQMALLAQRAENGYVGAQTGIMDQFISANGKRDHALLLDCRSLEFKLAPIPPNLSLVICNTMVKHSNVGGKYNTRRAEVEEATAVIRAHRPEVQLLRDATLQDLDTYSSDMSQEARKRARHIISDSHRAEAMAAALEHRDLQAVGRLMAEAHASFRDDFEASCPEADLMVELANRQPGLVGARLTGGGFGGCTVNLVEQAHAAAFSEAVARGYHQQTGIEPDVFQCRASDGAHQVE